MKKRFLIPIALKVSIFFMFVLFVILFGSGYYIKKESKNTVNNMIHHQFDQAMNMAENHLELLRQMNKLNIGPMGLGGKTTCLRVSIQTHPTHIAGLPVAVNISCHALRSATRTL